MIKQWRPTVNLGLVIMNVYNSVAPPSDYTVTNVEGNLTPSDIIKRMHFM